MPHVIYILFVFALGACVGSFLNVVVWRLPRDESLVSPPSRCPICLHRLAWYDNIPVFGWLALRGRCRYCYTPISAQYPTIEFITGALFVLYYVLYFMVGESGPFWMQMRPDPLMGAPQPVYNFVTNIREHWPQYALAVFTISALLAASLIDARNFFIPLSIPILMSVIGLMYHTILDRPKWPGHLNVQSGAAGALALGAGIGVATSLTLIWTGRMRRSFAEGWPQLEIEKDPSLMQPKEGAMARFVRQLIERYRRPLTPEQEQVLARHQAAARARDAEEERLRKEDEAKNPPPLAREFTRADINREIRHEMVFLMPPILLGMAAFALVSFVPAIAGPWNRLVLGNPFVSGFLGSLLGGLVGAFTVWLTRILGSVLFGREAMGMGDVDLMFGVGTIIGAGASTVAFFLAPFFGLLLAIYMFLVGKRRELPYGPYLSLATAFVMIYYWRIHDDFRPGLTAMQQLVLGWFGGCSGGELTRDVTVMWEKIKLWTRAIVFTALALYVLVIVTMNWTQRVDGTLNLLFVEFVKPRVLSVVLVTAIVSLFGWWLLRAVFKTVRQLQAVRERSRTARLEKEVADMRSKASMLQQREAAASAPGFPVGPAAPTGTNSSSASADDAL